MSYSFRPMPIRGVECRLPSVNVCFFGPDPPRSLEDLPEQIQPAINRYAQIGGDEVFVIEFLCLAGKCIKAMEQEDDAEEAEGEPGGIGL